MSVSLYISHPEVVIDPKVPTPQWGLSPTGRARAETFAARKLLKANSLIYSSAETKALDLAHILAPSCNAQIMVREEMGENDRSATGFLTPDVFESYADRLFAFPNESVEGWECAEDAQKRIVGATIKAHSEHAGETSLIFTGHGCVGTLLKCHIDSRPIARSEDQGRIAHAGGGNVFAFDLAANRLICDWTPIEDWEGFDNV